MRHDLHETPPLHVHAHSGHHVSDFTSTKSQHRSCFICDVTHPGDNCNNNTWSNSRSCKQTQCAPKSHALSPRTDGPMLLKTEAAAYKPRQNTHRLLLLGFIQMTFSFHRSRELTMCWLCRTPDPAKRPPYACHTYEYHYFAHLAKLTLTIWTRHYYSTRK